MNTTKSPAPIEISTLAVIREGKMLLVRKEGLGSFILPGGKIEKYESLEDAVRREVIEELGCEITQLKYAGVFQDQAAGKTIDVIVHLHTGELASEPLPQAEIREIIWCSITSPQVPVAPSLERQIFAYFQE